MEVIYNNILPFKGFDAMNLFGVILARKDAGELKDYVLNHEGIHTSQMKELLYVPFYILYGVEYIINLIKYHDRNRAYKNISFEREAYMYQRDFEYLSRRKHYANYRLQ